MTDHRSHPHRWPAAALLVLGSLCASASATPYRLEAVSAAPSSFSDFTLEFDDSGDGLLQLGELTSFSGITIESDFYDSLTQVPNLAGVSTFSGACIEPAAADRWCFAGIVGGQLVARTTDGLTDSGSLWTFTRVPLVQPVPEPSGAALALLALAGLAAARRRQAG